MDGVSVVLDVLAPVDFRFGGFDSRPNLVLMRVFLCVFFDEPPYSLYHKSVRAVVLAALDAFPNKLLHVRGQCDAHVTLTAAQPRRTARRSGPPS